MDLREIDEGIFVSGQIGEEDVAELARAGFKTIICNRPDQEGADQTDFQQIENRALQHDIKTHYIPVSPPFIEMESVELMRQTISEAQRPILAYCRSGSRSAHLYELGKNS